MLESWRVFLLKGTSAPALTQVSLWTQNLLEGLGGPGSAGPLAVGGVSVLWLLASLLTNHREELTVSGEQLSILGVSHSCL